MHVIVGFTQSCIISGKTCNFTRKNADFKKPYMTYFWPLRKAETHATEVKTSTLLGSPGCKLDPSQNNQRVAPIVAQA